MHPLFRLMTIRQQKRIRRKFGRHVSFGDLWTNRWQTAKNLNFGEGTSCYDNVLVLGSVKVGKNCWIGPNVVLDGSGGLTIGDNVSVSAGVQIYSHNSVMWSQSGGAADIERKPTTIGSNVYIGPNSVIQMNVIIGNNVIIGALSFVNKDIPTNSKYYGTKIV